MKSKQPKRNDPCPCGSGKLYKHCCKPSRRKSFQHSREIALSPAPLETMERGGPPLPGELGAMLENVKRLVPADQAREFEQLLHKAEDVVAYEEMQDEIEDAAQKLEAYYDEFKALDLDQAADLADNLFAEERFRPFRFGAEEVHRAFEAVGYPQRYRKPTQRDAEILRDAVLHLADQDLRQHLARTLMMCLPEYVSAGRYLDAWMIQYSAFQMLEAPDESNPFLAEMFRLGLLEWAERIEAQQDSLLGELGVDPSQIGHMTPREIEAWLEEQMADPETLARFEAYLGEDTLYGDQARAEFSELERGSLHLLERDDADRFLLSPEEVEPWIPALVEQLGAIEEEAMEAAGGGAWDDASIQEDIRDVVFEVAQEMLPTLFTPERMDQLVSDLRAHSHDLDERGDKRSALYAHTAATTLERARDPAEEPFVIAVCIASLVLVLSALGQKEEAR
jgi:hypothetical protein